MTVIPSRRPSTHFVHCIYTSMLSRPIELSSYFSYSDFTAYYKHIAHIYRMGQKLHPLKPQQIINYHHK